MNQVRVRIHPEVRGPKVERYIYSQFAEHLGRCIYPGIWVGDRKSIPNDDGIRLDVVDALKALEIPALRWPGGCFADNYHWMDGIGPREKRPKRHNLWWNQSESNEFGTHEFIRFCDMIGTEPYICANVGSGTVEEARSWVEYCNVLVETNMTQQRAENGSPQPWNVRFWGVGNELWGCGGRMRPDQYADLYCQYANFMRKTDPSVELIACGSSSRNMEYWDQIFLERLFTHRLDHGGPLIQYLAIHHYLGRELSDLTYSDSDYYSLIQELDKIRQHIEKAAALCRAYSTPDGPIRLIIDEWGTWYVEAVTENGLYQQNSMMDAVFAALSFHLYHEYAEDIFMTNMAQTINVLQALILTEGPKMCKTPTYHVFDLFKGHKDGERLPVDLVAPSLPHVDGRSAVSASATRAAGGKNQLTLSLVNAHLTSPATVVIDVGASASRVEGRILKSDNVRDHNTPDQPERVVPSVCDASQNPDGTWSVELPPYSVASFDVSI